MTDRDVLGASPIQTALAEWTKPEVHRIEAQDAETAPAPNPDGGINS
jgi:hypothetical protein